MRLVLGIDEAGYGPRVGPLVVGACMVRVPSAIRAVGGDIWDVFAGRVLRPLEALDPADPGYVSPAEVFVGDSKMIHHEHWPDELERAALSLLEWQRSEPVRTAADVLAIAGRVDVGPPWLAEEHGDFPLSPHSAARLARLSGRAVTPVWMGARVLSSTQFNRACERAGNKAIVNWALVALLIEAALEEAAGEAIEIVVDRQGGRVHYEGLLRQLFGSQVQVLEKQARRSAYQLVDDDRVRSIEFLVGGDIDCFCVSAASIHAKYIRELLMSRLNGFFCSRVSGLAPTTGYFSDGNRFVRETEALRRELKIADADFVRCR